jgi:hypothetical protein
MLNLFNGGQALAQLSVSIISPMNENKLLSYMCIHFVVQVLDPGIFLLINIFPSIFPLKNA